jgi:glycosyltransferase domain-containing protein
MNIFDPSFIIDNKEKFTNQNLNKTLTVIIPIKDESLDRVIFAINYYSLLQCRIIILDGSDKELSHLKDSTDVEYLHFKNRYIINRVLEGSNLVKTDYVLLVALDDFVNLDAISDAFSLIYTHDCNYVSGPGLVYKHNDKTMLNFLDTDSEFKNLFRKIRHFFVKKSISYLRTTLLSESKTFRMNSLLAMYNIPILFGLYKTNQLKSLFQQIDKNKFDNANFNEILASLILTEIGKIGITESIFVLRSSRKGFSSNKNNYTIHFFNKFKQKGDLTKLKNSLGKRWWFSSEQFAFNLYCINTSSYLTLRYFFNILR